jgi:hypothetical protein
MCFLHCREWLASPGHLRLAVRQSTSCQGSVIMSDDTDSFCKIFLDAPDSSLVMGTLSQVLGGEFQRRAMELADATLDVRSNSDAGSADDFVAWPVVAETAKNEAASWEQYVALVARVITVMWDSGIPAVAACDFEERLPWNGGIDRTRE